jgi:citrate lyase subunit beta / citryl-CoA lyase
MKNSLENARSFLFVPANRPERFLKATASGADAVILDLEDSVPFESKKDARLAIKSSWQELKRSGISLVIRINSPETKWGLEDLDFFQGLDGLNGVMVPKCESSSSLNRVSQDFIGVPLLPIIESAAGYLALPEIAKTANVSRLVVGHIDFLADSGMLCSEDQLELNSLRFQVAMCSRVGGLAPAIDGVTVSVDDVELIRADAERSIRFGFGGKLCIHPKQISIVHEILAPSADQISWANKVIDAMEISGGAAVQLDGKMIDLPVLLQAKRLLSRVH